MFPTNAAGEVTCKDSSRVSFGSVDNLSPPSPVSAVHNWKRHVTFLVLCLTSFLACGFVLL